MTLYENEVYLINYQSPDQTETFFDHENCILMYQTYIWEVTKKNIRPEIKKGKIKK